MTYDLAVIGAGSGGLTVAAAAAQFGRKVVLFEMGKMGGDCLNYGCVPSKALIAAANHAHAMRSGRQFGIGAPGPRIDFAKVHAHVQSAIAAIAPNDSEKRFEKLGVHVVRARARFRDRSALEANGEIFSARRFVIATGSRPTVPAIPGLKDVPYFTNETLYDSKECPDHLIILGGGPIGMEMALAFRRLGSRVTVIEASEPLNKEDPELAAVVLNAMVLEGVEILRKTALESVARNSKGIAAKVAGGRVIEGTHLLVAAGRQPNIEDLNLEAAGIARTEKGVTIDRGLRTTNRKVYAIGDVAGAAQFTHLAACHAGLVVRNALFGLPVNAEAQVIPRVTFTDPELAQAGLTEAEARAIHGDATTILREPFAANDRAQTDGKTEGLIKVVMGKRGRILGVGIVGKGAGEIIQPWILAMSQKLGVKSLVDMVAPYPTRGNLNRGAALKYYASLATNPWVRRVIDVLARFR